MQIQNGTLKICLARSNSNRFWIRFLIHILVHNLSQLKAGFLWLLVFKFYHPLNVQHFDEHRASQKRRFLLDMNGITNQHSIMFQLSSVLLLFSWLIILLFLHSYLELCKVLKVFQRAFGLLDLDMDDRQSKM